MQKRDGILIKASDVAFLNLFVYFALFKRFLIYIRAFTF